MAAMQSDILYLLYNIKYYECCISLKVFEVTVMYKRIYI